MLCNVSQVDGHNDVTVDSTTYVPGELDSYIQMLCNLGTTRRKRDDTNTPNAVFARGYNVSVSNDGTLFSIEDSILIYDSSCVECSNNGTMECSSKVCSDVV